MAEYETISITLVGFPPAPGKPAPHLSILAQTQKGSGLAYHLCADEPEDDPTSATETGENFDGENEENVYIITQIGSGRRLGGKGVATPRQAKLWIGLLCKICDWNKDLNTILATARGNNRREKLAFLAGQIEQARLEAVEQTFFVVTGE